MLLMIQVYSWIRIRVLSVCIRRCLTLLVFLRSWIKHLLRRGLDDLSLLIKGIKKAVGDLCLDVMRGPLRNRCFSALVGTSMSSVAKSRHADEDTGCFLLQFHQGRFRLVGNNGRCHGPLFDLASAPLCLGRLPIDSRVVKFQKVRLVIEQGALLDARPTNTQCADAASLDDAAALLAAHVALGGADADGLPANMGALEARRRRGSARCRCRDGVSRAQGVLGHGKQGGKQASTKEARSVGRRRRRGRDMMLRLCLLF